MRIGEFAKRNAVTVRALHHYEQMGLIAPDRVDKDTGYRYYRPGQGARLQLIATLKQLGFSLSEIAGLLAGPVVREELLRALGDKLLRVRHEMNLALTRRQGLEALEAHVLTRPAGAFVDLKEVSAMTIHDIRRNLPMEELAQMRRESDWEQACQSGAPLSAVVLDIDHMMHINETYGTKAGDEIMDRVRSVAIRQSPKDSWMEHSGDEIIMLLRGADAEAALAVARSICDAVRGADFSYAGCSGPVTVSAGVADRRSGARSAAELIHQADTAMMDVKTGDRGRALAYRP